MFSIKSFAFAVLIAIVGAQAERHVVHFDNRCGRGTPTLIRNGTVLSTGGEFVSDGPLYGAIAYLQTGSCGFNGDGCTLIETTLVNPISLGAGSSTDISLVPPYAFSVTTGFGYYGGCDGAGSDCTGPTCVSALRKPNDNWAQVACQAKDVNLAIAFCA